jgi:phage FluMu protein Com
VKHGDRTMASHTRCPTCGKGLRVSEKLAGKAAPCPNCKTLVNIPLTVAGPCAVEPPRKRPPAPPSRITQATISPPPLSVGASDDPLGFLHAPVRREAPAISRALTRIAFLPKWVLPSLGIVALTVGVGSVAFFAGRSSPGGKTDNTRPVPTTAPSPPETRAPGGAGTTALPKPGVLQGRPYSAPPLPTPLGGPPQSSPTTAKNHNEAAQKPAASDESFPKPSSAGPFDLPTLIQQVEQAVVRIDTEKGMGTGFLTENNTTVVTNFHVIRGSSEATATFQDGSRGACQPV